MYCCCHIQLQRNAAPRSHGSARTPSPPPTQWSLSGGSFHRTADKALWASDRLIDQIRHAALTTVVDRFEARLAAADHAIYEVRRLTAPPR